MSRGPCGNRICNLDELCWTHNELNETITLQIPVESARPDQEWDMNNETTPRITDGEKNGSKLVTFSLMGSQDIYARFCWGSMRLGTSKDSRTKFYVDRHPDPNSDLTPTFKLRLKDSPVLGQWYLMADSDEITATQDPGFAILWTYDKPDDR